MVFTAPIAVRFTATMRGTPAAIVRRLGVAVVAMRGLCVSAAVMRGTAIVMRNFSVAAVVMRGPTIGMHNCGVRVVVMR